MLEFRMDISPSTTSASSSAPSTSGLVNHGTGNKNAEFWDPVMNLLLTIVAKKYNYNWRDIREYFSSTCADHGLKFTMKECETQFKIILDTTGSEELFPPPKSVITRLLIAQLRLAKEAWDLSNLRITPEQLKKHVDELMLADELSDDSGTSDEEASLNNLILAALPTDEEDLDDPDPVVRRMRKLRKQVRLRVRNGESLNYDGDSSDLEDEYEPLRVASKKWEVPEDSSTDDELNTGPYPYMSYLSRSLLGQSVSRSTTSARRLTIGPLEKNKIISRIFRDMFGEGISENGNGQGEMDKVKGRIFPETRSPSAVSFPTKVYTDTDGKSQRDPAKSQEKEEAVGSSSIVAPIHDFDVELRQEAPVDLGGYPAEHVSDSDDESIAEEIGMGQRTSSAPQGSTDTDTTVAIKTQNHIRHLDSGEVEVHPAEVGANNHDDIEIQLEMDGELKELPGPSMVPISRAPRRQSAVDQGLVSALLALQRRIERPKFAHTFYLPSTKSSKGAEYYAIIEKPLSLKTIRMDVRKGVIGNFEEYATSLSLMFANAMVYRRVNHQDVYNVKMMEITTAKLLDEYRNTQYRIQINNLKGAVEEEVATPCGSNPSRKRRLSRKPSEADGGENTSVRGGRQKLKRKCKEQAEERRRKLMAGDNN